MGSIRLVSIPFEKKGGLPQLFRIGPSCYGRKGALLLDEAVHFYNYPAVGIYENTSDWSTLSPKKLNSAILVLHDVFKEDIVKMLDKLYTTIPGHLNKETRKNYHGYHSERGILCTKLLISSKYRNPKMEKALAKKPNTVHFREFERLKERVGLLRTLVSRAENIYENSYIVKNIETRKALFEPVWGGSLLIKPRKDIWKTHDRFWDPEKPIYPYTSGEVGPTEKLYFSLSSDVFNKLHNVSFAHSRGHFSRTKDDFLRRIYAESKVIRQIMPSLNQNDKRIIIWKRWQRNLEHLAYIFEKASQVKIEKVWMPIIVEGFPCEIIQEKFAIGVGMGFPAAMGLVGILFAYLTDLMARTLMSALSSAIIDIYEEISGYTAVALYEALSGQHATTPVGPETLIDEELVGILSQWRKEPQEKRSPWGDAIIDEGVREYFRELLDGPLITRGRWKNTLSYKKQRKDIGESLSFTDFYEKYIPRFPVLKKEFYVNLSLPKEQVHNKPGFDIKNWYADEKLYGATFGSQIHIFIAFQLLEKSKEILKWNWDNNEYKFKEGNHKSDKLALNKKRLPYFFITAGSFVFGGRKRPHITHRHGVNFDFILGPDLISWPVAKISDYIVDCKKDKKCKEWLKKFSNTNKRKKFLFRTWRPRTHVICYTKLQENKYSTLSIHHPPMVFRSLILDELVYVLMKEVRKHCAASGKGVSFYSENEIDEYKKIEERLQGTPHFIRTEDEESLGIRAEERTELADWQRTHAGHLSILLSAPRQIIYGSPIVHFRALHAIRQALKAEGVFGFEFECTDEFINYLNDPEKFQYQPPDTLCEIFLSNRIPLAPAHKIEKKTDCEWILNNYEREFRLKKQNKDIGVYFLVTNDLIANFSSIINIMNFSFMPDNHHNHWHVDYASNRLDIFKSLWLLMGVDLRGFKEYLSNYRINQHPLLKSVTNELETTRTWCQNYVEEFGQIYGEKDAGDNDQQMQNRTISNALMEAIFGVYKNSDSLFIKPAVTIDKASSSNQCNAQAKHTEELKEKIQYSEKMIFGDNAIAKNLYRRGKIKDINYVKWGISFVREQEPLDIRTLFGEDYTEPELEDYEPQKE